MVGCGYVFGCFVFYMLLFDQHSIFESPTHRFGGAQIEENQVLERFWDLDRSRDDPADVGHLFLDVFWLILAPLFCMFFLCFLEVCFFIKKT